MTTYDITIATCCPLPEPDLDEDPLVEALERGVPTVPTVLVEQGSARALAPICRERGWSRVVVKPAVSAGSFETHVIDSAGGDRASSGNPVPLVCGYDAPPEQDAYVHEDRVDQGAGGECCPVTFAYAPQNPAEVQEAVLRGSLYPLDTVAGVPLQETDGVWSGEACLAPDQYGTYHYEVGLRTAGDELFSSVAHNPHAPTTTEAGEVINEWAPADDCASLDVAIHAKTSE